MTDSEVVIVCVDPDGSIVEYRGIKNERSRMDKFALDTAAQGYFAPSSEPGQVKFYPPSRVLQILYKAQGGPR